MILLWRSKLIKIHSRNRCLDHYALNYTSPHWTTPGSWAIPRLSTGGVGDTSQSTLHLAMLFFFCCCCLGPVQTWTYGQCWCYQQTTRRCSCPPLRCCRHSQTWWWRCTSRYDKHQVKSFFCPMHESTCSLSLSGNWYLERPIDILSGRFRSWVGDLDLERPIEVIITLDLTF